MRPSACGVKKKKLRVAFQRRQTMEANAASFLSSAQQNEDKAAQNRKKHHIATFTYSPDRSPLQA